MAAALPNARGAIPQPLPVSAEIFLPGPGPAPREAGSPPSTSSQSQGLSGALPAGAGRRRDRTGAANTRGAGAAEPEGAAQIDAKFSVADFVPSQPATTTLSHSEELARCRSRPAWVAGGETTEKCSGHSPFFLVPILQLHFISNLHFFFPRSMQK